MTENNHDIPFLIGHEGHLDGQRWMLQKPVILGRDESCDIPILDRQVSRRHAQVTPTNNGVILEDLGSKNGTHHNGRRISAPVTLEDGDVIHIALAQKFIFLSSDATLPLEYDLPLDSIPYQRGKLRLEERSHRVWIGDVEMLPPLSASQYILLKTLYDHEGQVVPRDVLIAQIWGDESAIMVSNQALDALVRRLRNRIAAIDPNHVYIVTVRGHGLRLDNPPA